MKLMRVKIQLLLVMVIPILAFGSYASFQFFSTIEELTMIRQMGDFGEHGSKANVERAVILLQDLKLSGVSVSELASITPDKVGEASNTVVRIADTMLQETIHTFYATAGFMAGLGVFFFVLANAIFSQISRLALSMKLLLDHTDQGFMIFDEKGLIQDGFSRAAETFFGQGIKGKSVASIFKQTDEEWKNNLETLFSEPLPFQDIAALLPSEIVEGNRVMEVAYRPVRNAKGKVYLVLLVVSDVTQLREVQKKSDEERILNRAIVKIISRKSDFVDVGTQVERLSSLVENVSILKIELHTLKSAFAFFGLDSISKFCHQVEEAITSDPSAETIKTQIEALQGKFNEFVFEQHAILRLNDKTEKTISVPRSAFEEVKKTLTEMHLPQKVIDQVDLLVQKPIEEALAWLDDAFQATARQLGKRVNPIEWLPSDLINPEDYPGLIHSLVHIVRNVADHGIEAPEERAVKSKSEMGSLMGQLIYDSGYYMITFIDDGAGVNLSELKDKAFELGIDIPHSEAEMIDLVFRPELSTKKVVSITSGRGVGMAAVREEARRLGGDAKIMNRAGGGTQIQIWFRRDGVAAPSEGISA